METKTPQAVSPALSLDAFDYHLPEELIARYPLPRRDDSRMLMLNRATGALAHQHFQDFPTLLHPGDVLVLNNTKVLPARVFGHRQGHTGRVEVLFLQPDADNPLRWQALLRPKRKLAPGTVVEIPGTSSTIRIEGHREYGGGDVLVELRDHATVYDLMEAVGEMPIPPYLSRTAEAADAETYQTVYAKVPGSQAAPTAGLHFTPAVLDAIRARGVAIHEVTLSVSSGTFRPVLEGDITRHQMDPEHYSIPPETAEAIQHAKAAGHRVVAVGTTVTKTLETSAYRNHGQVTAESAWSQLFIYPGFQFQVVDALLTNFHLPKSTLMMLISAYAGRDAVMAAYAEAVENRYRFFSYGDCMLIHG